MQLSLLTRPLANLRLGRRLQICSCEELPGLLTFFAVFAFPARQAGQLPVAVAGVVAEAVVPGRALLGAALSVVALVADEAVGISELRLLRRQCVLGPVGPNSQLAPDGK